MAVPSARAERGLLRKRPARDALAFLSPPLDGCRPRAGCPRRGARAPLPGALPVPGDAGDAGPSRGRAARTHPGALRELVPAERVVQVEAHHVALGQGKVLLHRRAGAAAAGGQRRRRRRKRREEEGARAALPAEPSRAGPSRAEPSGAPRQPGPPRPGGTALPSPAARPLGRPGDGGAGTGGWPGACPSARVPITRFPPRLCVLEAGVGMGAPARMANRSLRGVLGGPVSRREQESALVVTGEPVPHRRGPTGNN